jgi:endo-1,4-beta-mannosidase
MRFRVGINYWPASSAMYWWQQFNQLEVERDFARIKEAGFDSVRIFLLWEDFQPAPCIASDQALTNLATVADVAAGHDLTLIPTLFTGHMSGVNWLPEWALDSYEVPGTPSRFRIMSSGRLVKGTPRNWYTDDSILEAQLCLARQVAARLRDKQAIWAYDLGNENSNCVVPPSREAATRWLQAVAGELRSVDPSRPITIGLHMEDLEEDRNLGPAEAAMVADFLCMHGYPIYSTLLEDPEAGSADANPDPHTDAMLLPFLGLITQWLAGSGMLDVLFEEFGAPTVPNQSGDLNAAPAIPLLEEQQAAIFTGRALKALHRFGFLGAMVWCYGDYASALWSQPPLDQSHHERSFGLWRQDQTAKPALAQIRRCAGAERQPPYDGYSWINIERSAFYDNPAANLRLLYKRFRKAMADSAPDCLDN